MHDTQIILFALGLFLIGTRWQNRWSATMCRRQAHSGVKRVRQGRRLDRFVSLAFQPSSTTPPIVADSYIVCFPNQVRPCITVQTIYLSGRPLCRWLDIRG